MTRIRINRFIGKTGAISRRKADELIANGRVKINGRIAAHGDTVDPTSDEITLDNIRIAAQKTLYLALYKPRLVLTTMDDPQGRPCIKDMIQKRYQGVFPVGRLDYDAEGLLLLTNNGDLAHAIHHPSYQVHKVYMVGVTPRANQHVIEHMERGINLDGKKTLPAKVEEIHHTSEGSTLRITLMQGIKNQIKRMADVAGLRVVSIKRIRVGPVSLKGMFPGQIRELRTSEVTNLHKILKKHKKP